MFSDTVARTRLVEFYEEHSHSIELDDFNSLLSSLGLDEMTPIQEVEVTVTFRVDVSGLEAFNKDSIEVSDASLNLTRSDTFDYGNAAAYCAENVVSIEILD